MCVAAPSVCCKQCSAVGGARWRTQQHVWQVTSLPTHLPGLTALHPCGVCGQSRWFVQTFNVRYRDKESVWSEPRCGGRGEMSEVLRYHITLHTVITTQVSTVQHETWRRSKQGEGIDTRPLKWYLHVLIPYYVVYIMFDNVTISCIRRSGSPPSWWWSVACVLGQPPTMSISEVSCLGNVSILSVSCQCLVSILSPSFQCLACVLWVSFEYLVSIVSFEYLVSILSSSCQYIIL